LQELIDHLPSSAAVLSNELSARQTRNLLLGLGLATGMEFYTFDSMNLVLTDLTGTLGVSRDEASWLLTIYNCFIFLGVPLSIWLAGHLGYKRFLMGTIVLFALAAVGCALSPTLGVMLIWRALQGLTAAGLVVWWRAGIYLILPKAKRSPSLMNVSTGLYLASASGLIFSGYITDHINWRLIFFPNLILAAAAIWLLNDGFPNLPQPTSPRFRNTDCWGLLLLATCILSLQLILSRGHIDDWFGSAHIRALTLMSPAALIAFIFWQHSPRNLYPLLDTSLIRDRNVMAAGLIGICTGIILSGSLYVLPEFLRLVDSQTHSATQTGCLIAFYAIIAAAVRPIMSKLVARFGPRKMVAAGLTILIVAMLLLNRCLTTSTPDGYFLLPLALYACCLSSLLPSVGAGTIGKLEQSKLLDGVSFYMTFRQLGASLGVAFLTIFIERRETIHSSRLYEHLISTNETTDHWLGAVNGYLAVRGGADDSGAHLTSIGMLARVGSHQVDVLSYADCFLFMAAVGAFAMCLIPLMSPFEPAKR
jgi:MFS transporter, DHA2 family, multidrug resistance protein